ncbi:MAG: hypothetical protein L3J66_03940 [Bacteroidales bacterium]|nr:hypothetical protein [Bacteroidales bacterium]
MPEAQSLINPAKKKVFSQKRKETSGSPYIVLDFEGLGNNDPINDFYNGGLSGQGNAGVNYGIEFGTALGKIDADAGGNGNFANEPSPSTIMFFLSSNQVYLNVAAGFTNAFSCFYTAGYDASIEVYDGLNGTGNLLGSAILPANGNNNCTGDPNGWYCNWDPVGITFSGTAKSVVFGGNTDYVGFDDVTFGTPNPGPPPIPLSKWSLLFGVLLIAVFIGIRFIKRIA